MSAQCTGTASQSLTRWLSSPPTYWIAWLPRGSSGSGGANRASPPDDGTGGTVSPPASGAVVAVGQDRRGGGPARRAPAAGAPAGRDRLRPVRRRVRQH